MEKTFRTSMFGFNKEDVAKYIYQQDKAYEKKLAEKNAALEEANTARKNAEQNARDWEKNNEKIKDLQTLLKRFRDLSEFLHVSIEEDDTAMDAVENGYKRLEDRCAKLEAFRDKANKFDSLASALSGIFGNGIQNVPGEEMQDDADVGGISPIHQARVNQDTIKRTVKDLDGVCEEIAAVIESLV